MFFGVFFFLLVFGVFDQIIYPERTNITAPFFTVRNEEGDKLIDKVSFEPPHDKINNVAVCPASAQSDQSLRSPHEETLGP